MDRFFERPGLITEDVDTQRVGILNENPQATLDVNGDIRAEDVVVDDITADLVQGDVVTARALDAKLVLVGSNLFWNGHSLYDEYPGDDGFRYPWFDEDSEGMIHWTWLRRPRTVGDTLKDIFDIASLGVQVGQVLYDAYKFFNPDYPIEQAVIDALREALDGAGENALRVGWNNLMDKPIAVHGTNDIGARGDVYVADAQSLKVLDASKFMRDGQNSLDFITTSGAETLLNFGSKEGFFNRVIIGNESHCNWIRPFANDNLQIGNFVYTGGSIFNVKSKVTQGANVSMDFSIDSNQIVFSGGDVVFVKSPQIQSPSFLATDKIRPYTKTWGHDFTFSACNTRIRHAGGNDGSSSLTLYNDTLEYETQASESAFPIGVKPKKLQFSVDSNGTAIVGSNLLFTKDMGVIRAYESNALSYREGKIEFGPDRLRFSTIEGDNPQYTVFAANSNGIFATKRCVLYGSNENLQIPNPLNPLNPMSFVKFARLESRLDNGLVWGWGFSNNPLNNDYDVFRVTKDSELSLRQSSTGLMRTCFDSEARFSKGPMIIGNDGAMHFNGQPVVTKEGALMRRGTNSNGPAGFLVSPNGNVLVGSLQIAAQDGTLTSVADVSTKCNMSASNFTASNISACNLVYVGSNLTVGGRTLIGGGKDIGDWIVLTTSDLGNYDPNGTDRYGLGQYIGHTVRLFAGTNGLHPASVRISAPTNGVQDGTQAAFQDFLTVLTGEGPDKGWVGVNTVAPLARFHVNGEIYESNDLLKTKYGSSNNAAAGVSASNSWYTSSNTLFTRATWSSNALSNCRRNTEMVPYSQISGAPTFDSSSNSLAIGGIVMGTAGLLFGGAALLNQNGQVIGDLADAAGRWLIRPEGYARFDDAIQVGNQANNNLRLTSDSIEMGSETTPLLRLSTAGLFTPSADIGFATVKIRDQSVTITNGGTSNVQLSSGTSWFLSNLGIGTSNPTERLHVNGNVRANDVIANGVIRTNNAPIFEASYDGFGASPEFVFRNQSSACNSVIYGGIRPTHLKGDGRGYINLFGYGYCNGQGTGFQPIVITSGNFGIGLSNPSERLHVNGNAIVTGTLAASNITMSGDVTCTTSNLSIRSSNLQFQVGQSGVQIAMNPAIGASGFTRMTLMGPGGAGYTTAIQFMPWSGRPGGPSAGINGIDDTNCSTHLTFATAPSGCPGSNALSERVRITSSGLVGIGTTTPAERLHVNGNAIVTGDMKSGVSLVTGETGTGALRLIAAHGLNYIQSGSNNTVNSAAPLLFTTISNGTEWARFSSSGNLGIATNNPQDRLHVNGNIRTSGAVRVQGNNVIELGFGVSGKEQSAGKIGYGTFSTALDIVGAGAPSVKRTVRIWDDLVVNDALTVGGNVWASNAVSIGNSTSGTPDPLKVYPSKFGGVQVIGTTSNDQPMEIVFDKRTTNATNVGAIGVGPGSRHMYMWYNGSDRFTLDAQGNVGIGKAPTAAHRLDVNGSINGSTLSEGGVSLATKYGTSAQAAFGSNLVTPLQALSNAVANALWRPGLGGCFTLCNTLIWTNTGDQLTLENTTASAPAQVRFHKTEVNPNCEARVGITETSRNFFVECQGYDRINIDTVGNVGIGTSNPEARLHSIGPGRMQNAWIGGNGDAVFSHVNYRPSLCNGGLALSQTSDGNTSVGCAPSQTIGFDFGGDTQSASFSNGMFAVRKRLLLTEGAFNDTQPGWALSMATDNSLYIAAANDSVYMRSTFATQCNVLWLKPGGDVIIPRGDLIVQNRGTTLYIEPGRKQNDTQANHVQYEIPGDGVHFFWDNVQITGAMTAGSKYFRIAHPVREGHDLVHTCIEGPQADLVYRGRATLSNGQGKVNIDEACGMSPGTFEALCEVDTADVFVTSRDSFISMKGVVNGGEVHLKSDHPRCCDTVSWLVVARRKDVSFDIEPPSEAMTRPSEIQSMKA
jgi:hypothetical protein